MKMAFPLSAPASLTKNFNFQRYTLDRVMIFFNPVLSCLKASDLDGLAQGGALLHLKDFPLGKRLQLSNANKEKLL
ncbi:hypothetical protein [Microcoleus sp. FACHB-672]|uniref:hypothetical protein n=1 Tax=Microcoleus sp. FACHB-672 TaxID=2692825 RepID=UPI001A7F06A6|nr:hypothetical protein [Microcoleus sp. FACHB-672]